MTRLIDADALIQELKDSIYKTWFGGDDFESGNEWWIKWAIERINSAPTVLGDNLSPWIPVTFAITVNGKTAICDTNYNAYGSDGTKIENVFIWKRILTKDEKESLLHTLELPNPPTK